jgi:hypothetical protein
MSDEAAKVLFNQIIQSARDWGGQYTLTRGLYFNESLEQILSTSASMPGQQALFYNGKDLNGILQIDNAMNFRNLTSNTYIFDDTKLGPLMEKIFTQHQEKYITSYEYHGLTDVAVAKYTIDSARST